MMRVVVALFKTRVSPRFDYAQEFLIAETTEDEVPEKRLMAAGDWTLLERIKNVIDLKADALICGAIDICSMEQINFNKVEIYCCVTGEAEDALRCFLKGSLESYMMVGPGGNCCGYWQFGGHNGLRRVNRQTN
jgi:predicted Fe-Mo cluster-binding NifX family protein